MDPRLDRILKLIRLATNNPSDEEARAAALKAVQLMVEHRVFLSLEAPPAAPIPPPRAPQSYEDYMRDLQRQQQDASNAQQNRWWFEQFGFQNGWRP
jgi:uncharacterized protein DUF2786